MATSNLDIIVGLTDKTGGGLGKINKNLQNVGKIAAGAALGGVVALGAGIALVVSKAVPAASDLKEAINAVDVVFEDNADQILEWGKTADTQAGLAQSTFAQMAATSGAMLQNLGLDTATAADETIKLTERAADMASVFNTDVDQALSAIQAGLRGEADPLERFGVRLNAAAVSAKAVEMGLAKTTAEVDDAARAQASLALLYEQTDKIAGDFVNTSDGLANASRIQAAQWENFMAQVGGFLLPMVEEFQKVMMEFGELVMPLVTGALENIMPVIEGVVNAVLNVVGAIIDAGFGSIEFYESLGPLEEALGLSEGALRAMIESVQEFFARVQEALAPVIEFIQNNVQMKDVLIALGIAIAAVVIPAVVSLMLSLLPILLTIAAVIAIVVILRKAWESNWGGIRDKTKAIVDWLKDFIAKALKFIKDWWTAHGDEVIATVKWLWETAKEKFNNAVEFIRNLISTFLAAIKAFWDEHGEQIKATIQALWDGVVAIFEWFRDRFKQLMDAFTLAREGDWRGFGEKMREIWDDVWEKIKEIASNAWTAIKEAVGKGIEAVKKFFTETDWGAVGKSIITGIADGIDKFVGILKAAAKKAAKAAYQAITAFFKGGSPLQLFVDMGKNISASMASGIGESSFMPAQAAVNMAAQTASGATYNYYLTAEYGYQSQSSLAREVRMLEMLHG